MSERLHLCPSQPPVGCKHMISFVPPATLYRVGVRRWLRVFAAILILAGASSTAAPTEARKPLPCDVSAHADTLHFTEQSLLDGINAYRRERGLDDVALSPSLRRAALWKSEDRVRGGPGDHDDADRTWDQRISDCGYHAPAATGETLAAIQGEIPAEEEAAMVLRSWQESNAHDQILTDPTFRVIGLGRAHHAGSKRSFWTADFGSEPD